MSELPQSSPDAGREPLNLSGHRQWSGLWLGVASMGAVSGVIMVVGGAWAGWFLVVCFAPSAVILALSLRPESNLLHLDATGYTIRTTFRSSTIQWNEVERIGTVEVPKGARVAIRFKPEYVRDNPDATAIADALGGYHRTLPLDYGLDPNDLAGLMRSYAGMDR